MSFDFDRENLIRSSLTQGPYIHHNWLKSIHAFNDQPTKRPNNAICRSVSVMHKNYCDVSFESPFVINSAIVL